MSDIKLFEMDWGSELVVASWGHHDLHAFALAAVPWAGIDAACFEAKHLYVHSLGEMNGYDDWFEPCEAGDEGARAITMEDA